MKWLSKKNKFRLGSIAAVMSLLIVYFIFSALKLVLYLSAIGLLAYVGYKIFKIRKPVKKIEI
ncbi:hypothetical protein HQQ94_10635 [Shewanella sp. VB17]|uniref:hypothetical protein n=1 Tax=Shewanella sp. VB17 TaxID=2739432 RepID=UPI0015667E61|nr:hypothetical protein [Shewanella sp. VB17]NRD73687.1 hypothetical protein [Shewanella sp. VB17]